MKVTKVVAKGDTLNILGVQDGQTYYASGWLSATTNHFDGSAYQKDSHRKPNAKSRTMTDDEKMAYYVRLLIEQNDLAEPVVLFQAEEEE